MLWLVMWYESYGVTGVFRDGVGQVSVYPIDKDDEDSGKRGCISSFSCLVPPRALQLLQLQDQAAGKPDPTLLVLVSPFLMALLILCKPYPSPYHVIL